MATGPFRLSDNYKDARDAFLNAAAGEGIPVVSHIHPSLKGPSGEDLAIDVAEIIPPGASKLLIPMSGTHGIEGYAGSAVQTKALKQKIFSNLPDDTGVVLVHAMNPWGMAYFSRTNEDNIDLNRNFLPGFTPDDIPKQHPLTDMAQRAFVASPTDEKARDEFSREHMKNFQAALSQGQYTNPEGLFYGGTSPAWSNTVWRQIINGYAAGYRGIVHIDLHTGLGPRGHGEIISNNLPSQLAYQQALTIWPKETVKSTLDGSSVSSFLRGTIAESLLHIKGLISVTVEFGTEPVLDVVNALIEANRSFADGFKDEGLRQRAVSLMKAAFAPEDPAWLEAVTKQSFEEFQKALHAMDGLFTPAQKPKPGPGPHI